MYLCVFAHVSIIILSIYLFISIDLSCSEIYRLMMMIIIYVCMYINLSLYLLANYLYVFMSIIHIPILKSIQLHVFLSVCLYLSVCLSLFRSLSYPSFFFISSVSLCYVLILNVMKKLQLTDRQITDTQSFWSRHILFGTTIPPTLSGTQHLEI